MFEKMHHVTLTDGFRVALSGTPTTVSSPLSFFHLNMEIFWVFWLDITISRMSVMTTICGCLYYCDLYWNWSR